MRRSNLTVTVFAILLSVAASGLYGAETGTDAIEGKTIEKISIIGNRHTDEALIYWAFGIKDGDPASRDRIERGIRRLERFSGIERVELRTFGGERDGMVRIFLIISEAETRHIRPQVGRNPANEWAVGMRFTDTNLFGRDEKLYASVLLRGSTILEGSWMKPFFLEYPRAGIGFSAGFKDYSYPFPDYRGLLVDGDLRRFQTALLLRFNISDRIWCSLSPGMDWIDMADTVLTGQGTGGVPEAPSGTFSTLEIGVTFDNLDRPFYPGSGMRIAASRKDWGLLRGDAEIKNFRYRLAGTFAFRLGRLFLLARGRGVMAQGRVPLLLLQHLGGEGTIRGYEFGRFSGENSMFGSAEVRIPINFRDIGEPGNPMTLADFHIFVDGGACWSDDDELDGEKLNSGFGCGVNLIPPGGALVTIDYAWHLESSGIWVFNVGMRF